MSMFNCMRPALRTLSVFLAGGIFNVTILCVGVSCQERPSRTRMGGLNKAEAAAVLKALTKGWALIDVSPDVDFLVCVNESREELDFYPRKELVREMERSGLIENPDKARPPVRQPVTHYEGNPSGGEWREITHAGPILFRYRITPKGRAFLRAAPKLLGKPVRPLKVAASPVDILRKPLKVVVYDRRALQKLVDAFAQKAEAQIEAAFSPERNADSSAFSSGVLLCGPKLWRRLESRARLNGLRPGALLSLTGSLGDGKEEHSAAPSEDTPISTAGEVRLFWKTLRETIKLDESPLIRRAGASEASAYPHQDKIENDEFPSPDLSSLGMVFTVEANKSKFVVVVESEPQAGTKHFGPKISWIELMEGAEKQK
jgi:hypothetical protein